MLKFRDSQQDFAAQFAVARGDQDDTAATRCAHTLKGVAANVGAQGVRDAASLLETACLQGRAECELEPLLAQVCAALEHVMPSLAALDAGEADGKDDTVPVDADPEQVKVLLQRLAELLEDCDADAAEIVEQLRPMLANSTQSGSFRRLGKQVEDYEFDDALDTVQKLTEAMGQ